MFGQSLLSAFGIACTTDTDQLFGTDTSATSTATYQLNASPVTSIPSNTYPGTPSNITYAAGKFGNAAVFNGSSSKIDLPSYGSTFDNNFSVSLWFDINTIPSGGIISFITGQKDNYFYCFLRDSDKKVETRVEIGGTGHVVKSSTTFSNNSGWYHVSVTKSSTDGLKLYINGSLENSDATATGNVNSESSTSLLGAYGGGFYYLDGKIDQVRIFNTVLPASAITALYNETTTTATSASIDYISANPNSIAYYKMSDATDQLGNYNGTATNVNFNTEGKFGFAGAFNGSSSKIDITGQLPTSTTSDYGISCWVNANALGSAGRVIFSNFGAGGSFGTGQAGVYIWNSKLRFYIYAGTGNSFHVYDGSSTISTGTWYNIVSNIDINAGTSTSLTAYINGSPETLTFLATTTISGNSSTQLGVAQNTHFWDGKIDQIRIYDSALSAANVSTLYKEVECEPAAINALANFNTVLYTGNASTNQISTVGFAPGFTWIKARNTNTSPEAHDVVRGEPSRLWMADNTYAASTAYNGFVKLTSNGFDLNNVGSGGNVNRAYNYVAWNWKAALANLSTNFYTSSSNIEVSQTLLGSGSTKIFSISFWFKTSSNNEQYFINTGASSSNTGIGVFINPTNGYLRYQTSSGSSFSPYLSLEDRDLQDGKWHHAVTTYSSAGGTNDAYTYLYVDGQDVTSLCTARNSWTQGGAATWSSFTVPKIVFGKYADGNFYNIVGNLAQVRFFSDVVTSGEVSDLYTEPAASNNTLNYPAGAGCIAAYPLQTDAVDLSGNYSGASSNVTFGKPGYLTGNTDGTIPSTVAANPEAGFSIANWSGNGTASNIGHGLGGIPELMIIKNTTGTNSWIVGVPDVLGTGYLVLNDGGPVSTSNLFGQVPDATKYYFNTAAGGNGYLNGGNYIGYFFRSIVGYSKIGSYVGTSASGNVQYLEFEPAFLMIKRTDSTGSWIMLDNKRSTPNPRTKYLTANTNDAEGDSASIDVDFLTNGFSVGGTNTDINVGTYIFIAIA